MDWETLKYALVVAGFVLCSLAYVIGVVAIMWPRKSPFAPARLRQWKDNEKEIGR